MRTNRPQLSVIEGTSSRRKTFNLNHPSISWKYPDSWKYPRSTNGANGDDEQVRHLGCKLLPLHLQTTIEPEYAGEGE